VVSSTHSTCTVSSGTVLYGGPGPCTLTAAVAAGANYGAGSGSPQSFTVTPETQAITSADSAVATVHTLFTFTVTTTGSPRPSINKAGRLPKHLALARSGDGGATLAGIPERVGTYHFVIKATFGRGKNKDVVRQPFTLIVVAR